MDHVSDAIASLQKALNDTRRNGQKAFMTFHITNFGNFNRDEATISIALDILAPLQRPLPLPPEVNSESALVS